MKSMFNPNELQVAEFCDNLRRSMMWFVKDKEPLLIEIRNDSDDIRDESGRVVESLYMGVQYMVSFHRPALTRHAKTMAGKSMERHPEHGGRAHLADKMRYCSLLLRIAEHLGTYKPETDYDGH